MQDGGGGDASRPALRGEAVPVMTKPDKQTDGSALQIELQDVVRLIARARDRALSRVNEELIRLYWDLGKRLSERLAQAAFGEAYVDSLAESIAKAFPGIKGYNRRGLYRMRQFYELYKDDTFVSTLLTQVSWSQHLLLMSACRTQEERHFYMERIITGRYTCRELERQIDSGLFERRAIADAAPVSRMVAPAIRAQFLDRYVFEFVDVPTTFTESDLKESLITRLGRFILELGSDFVYRGREYRVQVGNHDYFIDLLFFHRGLRCLVALEFKLGEFKPEYVGKMNLYLEALDRDHRKADENPSVGIILCATKDDEVVQYALSRSLSPTLVAQYQLELPDKRVLIEKMREIVDGAASGGKGEAR